MTPVVLVVEEQPALCKRYSDCLEGEGYRVVSTTDPAVGLKHFRQEHPHVVVLDPDAKGGAGMKLALEILRADPSVLLVFNTSYPYHVEMDFSSWVADAYAVRSHGVEELAEAVRRVLGRRQAHSVS